jgi:hypothetical protein
MPSKRPFNPRFIVIAVHIHCKSHLLCLFLCNRFVLDVVTITSMEERLSPPMRA